MGRVIIQIGIKFTKETKQESARDMKQLVNYSVDQLDKHLRQPPLSISVDRFTQKISLFESFAQTQKKKKKRFEIKAHTTQGKKNYRKHK